ncbi:MAG: hypothetical protein H6877_02165 [Rhodobiaceae bacterium]|nr:hypothetical protein [Rhodobiaceae bacterium]MCC0060980.1 hypothetical protein [Rhodobiaceae bacterium]
MPSPCRSHGSEGRSNRHNCPGNEKISNKAYLAELSRLQIELVKLQEWVKDIEHRVAIIFEGRDTADKGGTVKRITEALNPRVCRVVALPAPIQCEKKQWKLSSTDLKSRKRWVDYSMAKDEMFARTYIKQAPWYVVDSDVKKHAWLDCINKMGIENRTAAATMSGRVLWSEL